MKTTFLTKICRPLILLSAVLCVLPFSRCRRSLMPLEYRALIESSDLFQKEALGENIIARVEVRPAEYIVAHALANNHSLDEEELEARKEQLDEQTNVVVSLSCENGQSLIKYLSESLHLTPERIRNYFNHQSKEDFFLKTTANDTVSCKLYEYEYSYGVSPHERFNLVFPKIEEQDWPIAICLPHPITGSVHSFVFRPDDYFNLPEIKS